MRHTYMGLFVKYIVTLLVSKYEMNHHPKVSIIIAYNMDLKTKYKVKFCKIFPLRKSKPRSLIVFILGINCACVPFFFFFFCDKICNKLRGKLWWKFSPIKCYWPFIIERTTEQYLIIFFCYNLQIKYVF